MTREADFIALMRSIAGNPAARGLMDDCAAVELGSETLILTHDMMVQGVHWLPDANPADVAWKLVAVNLSDLAAKGAKPLGLLFGFMLGDDDWDRQFAAGLRDALLEFDVALLGGDTVAGESSSRVIGMTAIGTATHVPAPSRAGAQPGDCLYVTGTVGDALAGFICAKAGRKGAKRLEIAFHRPIPLLDHGRALAPIVSAMMDVSDGVLLDASRMADASGLALSIDLASLPLSDEYCAERGDSRESRIKAASWGDDYQLLFAASADEKLPINASKIGEFVEGNGLSLFDNAVPIALPASLGFEHR